MRVEVTGVSGQGESLSTALIEIQALINTRRAALKVATDGLSASLPAKWAKATADALAAATPPECGPVHSDRTPHVEHPPLHSSKGQMGAACFVDFVRQTKGATGKPQIFGRKPLASALTKPLSRRGASLSSQVAVHVRLRPTAGHVNLSGTHEQPGTTVRHLTMPCGTTGGNVTVRGTAFDSAFMTSIIEGVDQGVAYTSIAQPLIDDFSRGFNCLLLAYGQTGSGKTHTLFGPPGSLNEHSLAGLVSGESPAAWGLFPRMCLSILDAGLGSLTASAIELLDEKAYDLLSERAPLIVGAPIRATAPATAPTSGAASASAERPRSAAPSGILSARYGALSARAASGAQGRARERPRTAFRGSGALSARARFGGLESVEPLEDVVSVLGETRMQLRGAADVARLARTVDLARGGAGHIHNSRGSRAHCLVYLHLTALDGEMLVQQVLVFADLASSSSNDLSSSAAWRVLKSGSEGEHSKHAEQIRKPTGRSIDGPRDGCFVNESLVALCKVIRALGAHAAYVPYRDSTLTQLLRSGLTGHSRTALVVNVASEAEHADETISSLEMGRLMAVVPNKPTIVRGAHAATQLQALEQAVERTRAHLGRLEAEGYGEQSISGFYFPPKPAHVKSSAELRALEARLKGARGPTADDEPNHVTPTQELLARVLRPSTPSKSTSRAAAAQRDAASPQSQSVLADPLQDDRNRMRRHIFGRYAPRPRTRDVVYPKVSPAASGKTRFDPPLRIRTLPNRPCDKPFSNMSTIKR